MNMYKEREESSETMEDLIDPEIAVVDKYADKKKSHSGRMADMTTREEADPHLEADKRANFYQLGVQWMD